MPKTDPKLLKTLPNVAVPKVDPSKNKAYTPEQLEFMKNASKGGTGAIPGTPGAAAAKKKGGGFPGKKEGGAGKKGAGKAKTGEGAAPDSKDAAKKTGGRPRFARARAGLEAVAMKGDPLP